MKHALLLTTLSAALLFSTTSQAQIPGVSKVTKALPKVDLGIKAGASFNQMTGSALAQSYKAGIVGGAFVGVYKNKIGVQAEGLVRSARFDFSGTASGSYVKTVSLDIPLMFEYKLIPRLWVQVGPQFSTVLSAKDNTGTDFKSKLNTTDISAVAGLQVKLPVHLVAGVRYIMGFTDANNTGFSALGEWKNRSIQAYVGFRFL